MTARSFDDHPVSSVLDAAELAGSLRLSESFWGFGGVHGGLSLSLLASAMRHQAQGRVLRSIVGHFKRPLRDEFEIEVDDDGSGRTVSWLTAQAKVNGSPAVTARAIYAAPGKVETRPAASAMPSAPSPTECPVFTIPKEFVPFSRRTEIRPVGTARPFIGAQEPELLAWLRFVDDDVPPDDARLIVLMDSLAPSYAAVLQSPVPLPTVTYSVSPGSCLAEASSPWILLRARTEVASSDGWIVERLDAWGSDGKHLGVGEQLRVTAARS